MKHSKVLLAFKYGSFYPKGFNIKCDQTFHHRNLQISLTNSPKQMPQFKPETLGFGKYSSDHMLTVLSEKVGDEQWNWLKPKIVPFQPLQINPFNSALHYAVQCFQGMKAYKNQKGQIRLFRPECNMKRLKASSKRVTLPDFDGEQLLKCIQELVKIQTRWIPPIREFSLYLRPLHISMQDSLGVKQPRKSQLLVLASPAGPYYATGFKPNALSCSSKEVRSCHGGTGSFKVGGNYAPTLLSSHQAAKKNYQQMLWLYGQHQQIVEVGASNIFFVFKTENPNIKEVVTPDLEDLVLPGVTRDSILGLLRNKTGFRVTERMITIKEVIQRLESNELLECFGAGTAVIVGPVDKIEYKGKQFAVPINKKLNAGDVTFMIRQTLLDIQNGKCKDQFGWIRQIK